jgi:hypothetical protein
MECASSKCEKLKDDFQIVNVGVFRIQLTHEDVTFIGM